MRLRNIIFCIQIALIFDPAYAQTEQIYINEILASNQSVNADPDFGNYGDWLELYNGGTNTVDLSGFSLTDDLDEPSEVVNTCRHYNRTGLLSYFLGRQRRRRQPH